MRIAGSKPTMTTMTILKTPSADDDDDCDNARTLLRLWHFASHSTPLSWHVIAQGRGHTVRRTLDLEVSPPGALGPHEWAAPLPDADFKTIMDELQRVSVCPAASCELVLDAGMFGVEVERYPSPVVLTWTGSAPLGWESLAAWHNRTRMRLNRLLPPAEGIGYEYSR